MVTRNSRIYHIVSLLENSETTIDVGCDHGYITEYILRNKLAKNVVATDISEMCLQKTKQLIAKDKFDNCEFVVTDGLQDIQKDNVDQIVIAGMGGKNIVQILHNAPTCCRNAKLILQPMSDIVEVRQTLNDFGYCIVRDLVVWVKNKFYHIIKAEKGNQKLTKEQLFCGAVSSDCFTNDYIRWLDFKMGNLNNSLLKISSENKQKNNLQKCLDLFKKIKEKYNVK